MRTSIAAALESAATISFGLRLDCLGSDVATGRGKRQTNLNLQTTFRAIGSLHDPAVKTHRAFGDGQTQSGPAGLAATGVVNAIKRPEEFVQRILRHAGA